MDAATFPLGALVRLDPTPAKTRAHWSGVWKIRTDEAHLCIVIQHLAMGDVRVWDTVENDWWSCGSEHLTAVQS